MHSRYLRSKIKDLNRDINACEKYMAKVMKNCADIVPEGKLQKKKSPCVIPILAAPAKLSSSKTLMNDEVDSQVLSREVYDGKNATIEVTVKTKRSVTKHRKCRSLNVVKHPSRSTSDSNKLNVNSIPPDEKSDGAHGHAKITTDKYKHVPWSQLLTSKESGGVSVSNFGKPESCHSAVGDGDSINQGRVTEETRKFHIGTENKRSTLTEPANTLNELVQELWGKINQVSNENILDVIKSVRDILRETNSEDANDATELKQIFDSRNGKPVTDIPCTCKLKHSDKIRALEMQRKLEASCAQMEGVCKEMEKTCEQLRKENKELRIKLGQKNKDLESYVKNEEVHLKTIMTLKQELEKSNSKVNEYSQSMNNLLQMAGQLDRESGLVSSLKESNADLKNKVQNFVVEVDELKLELQVLKLEKEKYEILINEKNNEIEVFRKEIMEIQNMITDQMSRLTNEDVVAVLRNVNNLSVSPSISDESASGKHWKAAMNASSDISSDASSLNNEPVKKNPLVKSKNRMRTTVSNAPEGKIHDQNASSKVSEESMTSSYRNVHVRKLINEIRMKANLSMPVSLPTAPHSFENLNLTSFTDDSRSKGDTVHNSEQRRK